MISRRSYRTSRNIHRRDYHIIQIIAHHFVVLRKHEMIPGIALYMTHTGNNRPSVGIIVGQIITVRITSALFKVNLPLTSKHVCLCHLSSPRTHPKRNTKPINKIKRSAVHYFNVGVNSIEIIGIPRITKSISC
jgi:hypothetical protein